MFTDLMVFDLTNEQGGVSCEDFEECLDEFMQAHYDTEVEFDNIQQIAKNMLKIRQEFTQSAMEKCTLESAEYDKWVKLNQEL